MKNDTGVGRAPEMGTALKKHVLLYAGFLVLALALLLVLNSGGARADNIPAGSISTDTNWNTTGSPYYIQGDVTIDPGVTLTVEDDVDIIFDGYYMLDVQGGLVINGDAAWVELYGNGGQWEGVFFSAADQACSLKNVSFSSADYPLLVTDSDVTLDGIYIDSSCSRSVRYEQLYGGDINAQISRLTSEASSPLFFEADYGNITAVLNDVDLSSNMYFGAAGNVTFDIVDLEMYGYYGVFVENGGSTDGSIDDAYIEAFDSSVHVSSNGDAKLTLNGSALSCFGYPIFMEASAVTLDVQNTTLSSNYNAVEVDASAGIYANFHNVMADSYTDGIRLVSGEDINAEFSNVTLGWNFYGSGKGVYTAADGVTKVSMVGCEVYDYSTILVEIGGAGNVSFSAASCYFVRDNGYEGGLYVHSDEAAKVELVNSQFYGLVSMDYQAYIMGAEGVDAYLFNDTFANAYYGCLYVETETGDADVWVEDSYFDAYGYGYSGAIVVQVDDANANVDVVNTEIYDTYRGLLVEVADGDADVNIDPSYFAYNWIGAEISAENVELSVADSVIDGEDWGYYGSGTGIRATAVYDLTAILDNLTVADYANGVVLWAQGGAADVTVTGCLFYSIYGYDDWEPGMLGGPFAGALSIMAGGSLEVTIGTCEEGNDFEDVGTAIGVACFPAANSVSNVSVINNTIDDAENGIIVEFLSNYVDTLGTSALEINVAIQDNTITHTVTGIVVALEFQTYYDEYLDHLDATTQEATLEVVISNNRVQTSEVGIGALVMNRAVADTENVNVTAKTTGSITIKGNELNCSGYIAAGFMNQQAAEGELSAWVVSDLELGITDNKIWTGEYQHLEYGVYVQNDCSTEDLGQSDVSLCATIQGNEISTSENGWTDYGINYKQNDHNGYYDSITASDATVSIQENDILIDGGYGIAVELSATSSYNEGLCDSNAVIRVVGNQLIMSGYTGILISNAVSAEYGEATVNAMRDVLVCNNQVTVAMDGSLGTGIAYYQDDYAYYDSANVTDDAAAAIQNNVIQLENCNAGIYVYASPDSYSAVGEEAKCHSMLSVTVSGNTLNLWGNYGIYIYGAVAAGSWYYEYPEAVLDFTVLVNQNKICVPEDQYLGVGIMLYPYADAYDSYYAGPEALCNLDATISSNTVDGAAYGIEFYPYAYSYYGVGYAAVDAEVSICNNILSNGGSDGIYVYAYAQGYSYSDELMSNVTADVSICENTINGFYYGIEVSWSESYWYPGSTLVDLNMRICNNDISECEYGIYLDSIDGLVSGNLVKDCYEGIYLHYCYDMLVSENTLSHNGVDEEGYALDVDYCSNITFEGNLIRSNEYGVSVYECFEIYFNGNEVSYSRFDGAYFYYCDVLSIEGNTFANNYGDGVYLYWNEEVVFGNNTVASNGHDGFVAYTDGEMRMFNGVFADNLYYGVYVVDGANDWFVDASCAVRNNAVYFEGSIVVQEGGAMTLDTVNVFELEGDYHGYGALLVEEGGSLMVVNCVIDGWWYAFDIQGNLDMDNSKVMGGKEVYLGPTCTADIRGCTIVNMIGNGIHIDNCCPRITGTIVALNGKDGIFIEGSKETSPIIQGCTIAANARGIFSEGASLDRVIGNLITMNSVAGIYVLEGSGKVADNTLLLNKVEIYLMSSEVQVCGNHIGYSSQIDRIYTLMLVLGEYGDVGDWYWAATPEMVADLLVNHIGIYAEDSDVKTSGNSYGMLTTAVYAIDSNINFGDNIDPCGCEYATVWYLSEELEYEETPVTFYDGYVLVNASIPTEVVNGIFLQGSSLVADGISMEVTGNGIFMDHAVATLSNCTLSSGEKDLYLVNGSEARVSDVSYDTAEVQGDSSLNVQNPQKPSGTIFGMDPVALVAVVLIIVIAILLGVFLLRRKK